MKWIGSILLISFQEVPIIARWQEDGIQVDKMRHIVYNIPSHSNAMITVPPRSPSSYDIYTDNFSPCFLVLDDTRHPFVLYGLHLIKGDAFLEYAWNRHRDGSYLLRFVTVLSQGVRGVQGWSHWRVNGIIKTSQSSYTNYCRRVDQRKETTCTSIYIKW